MKRKAEFDGERARLYEKALVEYPEARRKDLEVMYRFLIPQRGENILGFGEGNGYFCRDIAQALGPRGYYLVTDPSKDQLFNLRKRISLPQISTRTIGIEGLKVPSAFFHKVWSFGAFHHVQDQTQAMKTIYDCLRPDGNAVICDVFQGSSLAKHFDYQVARYSLTGHEVKFLSEEFARSLLYLSGFRREILIEDVGQKWEFESERDLGKFIHNLHAMVLMPGSEDEKFMQIYDCCNEILGTERIHGKILLNWPLKVMIAKK